MIKWPERLIPNLDDPGVKDLMFIGKKYGKLWHEVKHLNDDEVQLHLKYLEWENKMKAKKGPSLEDLAGED